MKLCKIQLIKNVNGPFCVNTFPVDFNPVDVNIFVYDEHPLNEGDNIGYCAGLVADDFVFTSEMTEITVSQAHDMIDQYILNIEDLETRDNFKNSRKGMIADANIE